uniref:G2/mitotic-specific cyclin-B3 n=1 Tax=Meloidogyne javanica TaxID=6303 RepID=A0A915LVE6_MELJA
MAPKSSLKIRTKAYFPFIVRGEVKIINAVGETCVAAPLEKTSNTQLISKKRTERFEVCLDEDEEIDDDKSKNDRKSINSEVKKRRDLSADENDNFNKLNGKSRIELLSPLPGKENVMPIKTPTKQDEKEYLTHFDTESIYNTAPESVTECLTAKSQFSIPHLKGQLTFDDPLYITYEEDIYKWMLFREKSYRPKTNFMDKQTHINAEMRAILIDWFVDVVAELELSPASFFLAISLTDRTLSVIDCPKERLQLLGATAILISTKVQEVFPPLVRNMEKVILRVADFQLTVPLIDAFAQLFDHTASTSAFPLNQVSRNLMWYFLELSTFDCFCVCILPSRLAAAAFLLASSFQKICQKIEPMATIDKEKWKLWSDEMVKRTRIKRSDLQEPAKILMKLQQKAVSSKFQALFKKFSCPKRCKVACLKPLEFEEVASQFSD